MKKFRKIAAVLLCVVMIAASLQCLAFAAPQDSGKLNFLVLGDSIAEGFGVENKEDAAYGKIVADTNGYNYRNLAQVANDTQDLIRKIETVDEFRESIAWADVINICIGSNNYLASKDVVWITIGALFGTNDEKLDEIAYGIYDDFNTIYSLIREHPRDKSRCNADIRQYLLRVEGPRTYSVYQGGFAYKRHAQ